VVILTGERTLLGLSDAGAHASQLCDAVFSTHLLEHWVRETGTLPLEKAVWRLTGQSAAVFGSPAGAAWRRATTPTWWRSTPPR
jgi:N-acyl-D-aspartate/D-glutamate deacylase